MKKSVYLSSFFYNKYNYFYYFIFIIIFIFIIFLYYYGSGERIIDNNLIDNEIISIKYKHNENDKLIKKVLFNNKELAYDKESNTYYYYINQKTENKYVNINMKLI